MHEGEHIRRIREAQGLKQQYVAREAGLDPSKLSRIEQGKRVLSLRIAIRLARILRCEVTAFDEGSARLSGPNVTT